MNLSRVVQYVFFFSLLVLAAYMVWLITKPFVTALALSAVIVTICYPFYERVRSATPKHNKSLASLFTTLFVLLVIMLPVLILSSLVLREAVDFFQDIESGELSIESGLTMLQSYIQTVVPSYQFDIGQQVDSILSWVNAKSWSILTGTASAIFVFLITLLGTFYFFRDGKEFLEVVIKASPLPDNEDRIVFKRLARAVRSVATGTVLTALIQGTLVAVGFWIFGIPRAILWGSIASISAVMPGIGTTIVTAPAVIYLFIAGDMVNATGLLVWSMLIVGMIDNLIAPYLIGRGNNLHPFIVLISVLGGVVLFGPIGFVIGPVVVTLFLVLLEIYNQYIVQERSIKDTKADLL